MSEKTTVLLINPVQAEQAWRHAFNECVKPMTMAGHRLILTIAPETRSSAQNRRMWAMLSDVAAQVVWHGQNLTAEDWKHIFSASLKRQRAVPGIDGGFVVLGQKTSKMGKREMGELMELIEAFGAENGVRFSAVE